MVTWHEIKYAVLLVKSLFERRRVGVRYICCHVVYERYASWWLSRAPAAEVGIQQTLVATFTQNKMVYYGHVNKKCQLN